MSLTISNDLRDLIAIEPLFSHKPIPILIQPRVENWNIANLTASQRECLEQLLLFHGALLFRGFNISDVNKFADFIHSISGQSQKFVNESSPRSVIKGNIFTSTDYPPAYPIFLHNEYSYAHRFPLKFFFNCLLNASEGGETPIADTRKIFKRIDPAIRNKFIQKKWMYVRNLSPEFGVRWQDAFQTENRDEVEMLCKQEGIQFEWRGPEHLKTTQICSAVARHPKTGEETWFNHAVFFHVSTLEEEVYEALTASFSEKDLPSNTYYGDGSAIETTTLAHLRDAYLAEKVVFPWNGGDVLLIDNMLTAHAREPFKGPRKIAAAMTEPCFAADVF